jgi:adenylate kinase
MDLPNCEMADNGFYTYHRLQSRAAQPIMQIKMASSVITHHALTITPWGYLWTSPPIQKPDKYDK